MGIPCSLFEECEWAVIGSYRRRRNGTKISAETSKNQMATWGCEILAMSPKQYDRE